MSRLAGLAKKSNNGVSENSSQESGSLSSTSSLAALAAGTKPRQSLSGLAGGSAKLSNSDSRIEPSNTTGRPSLQELARGSNATGLSSGLSRTQGGLSRLASSGLSKSSGTNSSSMANDRLKGAPGSLSPPLQTQSQSQLPSASSSSLTSTPSLTQLAGQNTTIPRRSLAGLATPTSNTSKQSTTLPGTLESKQPSVGLTRTGGSTLNGLGNLQNRNKSNGTGALDSPSLSSMATTLQKSRNSLSSLASPQSNTSNIEYSKVSEATNTQTSHIKPTDPTIQENPKEPSHSTIHKSPSRVEDTASTDSIQDYRATEDFEDSSTAIFSPLIAKPSHFATSIFEKLDPVPSPIALSANVLMQSNPMELFNSLRSSSGVITPKRIFQFDTLSPDDQVFKAQSQGMRSVASRS